MFVPPVVVEEAEGAAELVRAELLLVCCAREGCATIGAKAVKVTETAKILMTRRSLFMADVLPFKIDYRRENSLCILKNSWNVSIAPDTGSQ